MADNLKASLAELAHVTTPELKRALRQRSTGWRRFLPTGLSILAAVAVAVYRWRRAA